MSLHLAAYEQSASLAALTAIAAVPDPSITVSSTNDIRVPSGMNNILAVGALINSATATLRAQVQAPSLRAMMNFDVDPIVNGLIFGSNPAYDNNFNSPLALVPNEPLEFWFQNGAAVMNRGLILFGDGPVKPVSGKIYTVRATGAATLVTATWVNTALTFSQTLPAGHYQCVGFRAVGANLVAARLFFVGSPWRPGFPAVNTDAQLDAMSSRDGACGILGEFDNTTPPTVDCLGITDTTQIFFLDLIKTA